jgi:predicted nucleic acid-binding protein
LIYLDSSLVVSLYCLDANSAEAVRRMQTDGRKFLISDLVELEAVNAFRLKEFRKEITSKQAEASFRKFESALASGIFQRQSLPQMAFKRAGQLSRHLTAKLGTRTADILHVAAALELGATSFFSFDLQQRKMAEESGLKVNPWP